MRATGGSVSRRLVHRLARPIEAADRRRAALHVLDWLGTAAIGVREPAGRAMAAYASGLPAGGSPTVAGPPLAPGDAAFVDGPLGNTLEMDDFHRASIVHPGPVVVPAALALATAHGRSGVETLDAIVRGYEATIRVGVATGPAHYRYWHKTATCGAFGAAAAAASLLDLDEAARVHALGNAGTQAAGLWQCRLEPVMTKQLHNGHAARAGLAAAELAGHGFAGPEAIFEGELGFFTAMCPDGDPEAIISEEGRDWLIHETSFKPWPACRHAHPVIGAALALRARACGKIAEARIETYGDAIAFCDEPGPGTLTEAQFSLQHAFAVAFLRGAPGLADFDAAARGDPAIAALRRQVSLARARDLDAAYPRRFGARVTVSLTSGAQATAAVADALGDPEDPMSETAIADKAHALLRAAGRTDAQARTAIAAALALAETGTPRALYTALVL